MKALGRGKPSLTHKYPPPASGIADPSSAYAIAVNSVIINGIITLFTAMAYAELGSAMPEAGGGYLWVREGLPRPMPS